MLLVILLLMPFIAGCLSLVIRHDIIRRMIMILTACCHLILTSILWLIPLQPSLGQWFYIDPIGLLFLSIISILFLAASIYAIGYLRHEGSTVKKHFEDGSMFIDEPEVVFITSLLFFLGTMTVTVVSQHFGVFWVAMEATTLVTAPLIYFHRHKNSLEATWKYLLICSVGIGLALLGNLFLVISGIQSQHQYVDLFMRTFLSKGSQLHIVWVKAAFIFLLVGYGTKMGLAPLHTWLPDAHSEAPSVISALLSGALLNCAFLGIIRAHQVCIAAGIADFSQDLLLIFGLLSMACAAFFVFGQIDYKRMLAYSSIEHMGILAVGIGIGGAAIQGAFFHAVNHSFLKAVLFFTAGNILRVYKTKSIKNVYGLLGVLPVSAIVWFAGFLSLTGLPPSGIFLSKWILLQAACETGHTFIAILFLLILAVIFIGMANIFVPMVLGVPPALLLSQKTREPVSSVIPSVVLLISIIILGLYVPPFVSDLLSKAAAALGCIVPEP